jgi:hypothetical protein
MLSGIIGNSQPIIAVAENLPLKTTITSNGALSNQFSAFIVGEKPIALNNVAFAAMNKSAAKKMSVSIYKGLINGTNATLLTKLSSATINVEATNEFKKFTASFSTNLMLDAWGVYYIVLRNESNAQDGITVPMASNIGVVKGIGVTVLSGVFNQDIPVTGNAKGVIDANGFIGVSLNGPIGAPPVAAPSFAVQKFSGSVQRGKALLQWKMETSEELRSSIIEKSFNQKDFTEFSKPITEYTGTCIDVISMKTFYRLKFTDVLGRVSYSKVLQLEPRSFFSAKLLQTQLNKGDNIRMEISSSETVQTLVTVVNRFGQPVKKISQQVMTGYNNIQFSTADLAPGNYYVNCSAGSSNEFTSQTQIIIL